MPNLGLTYITQQTTADDRPEIVEKFLKATLKGVEFRAEPRQPRRDPGHRAEVRARGGPRAPALHAQRGAAGRGGPGDGAQTA